MGDWNRRIAQFARERKEEEWVVDEDMVNMAKSGQYGYDKMEETQFNTKQQTYQSYDQRPDQGEATPIKNEGRDSYDTIETDSEEDRIGKREDKSTDGDDEPLTKKIVIELLICILAFVGRGLCLNSVGPTLIDLRQIASLSVPQAAWIFVSQSTGFFLGSILAKIIFQEFQNELALSVCLFSQAIFTAFVPAFRSAVIMCIMFVGQGFAIGVVGIGVCATCIRIGGKKRNGMFLQAAYLGVSIGSVCGPFVARPFLSDLAKQRTNHHEAAPRLVNTYLEHKREAEATANFVQETLQMLNSTQTLQNIAVSNATMSNTTMSNTTMSNTTASSTTTHPQAFTTTHVYYYYVFIGLVLAIPASSFFVLYRKSGNPARNTKIDPSQSGTALLTDCPPALGIAIVLIFAQCLIYFGTQDTYSNLLTTFAVLGPLHFDKTKGVYVSSLFWASMCFGRLNGIWIAKLISPFKILVLDMTIAGIAAAILMIFGGTYPPVLWGFTAILGLSFATINGATVSWAAKHLPGNNYILAIIMVGRCAGLLVLPTTVTTLFKSVGPMTLMYSVFLAVCIMLSALLASQFIAQKFGVDGKLRTKSELRQLEKEALDSDY